MLDAKDVALRDAARHQHLPLVKTHSHSRSIVQQISESNGDVLDMQFADGQIYEHGQCLRVEVGAIDVQVEIGIETADP